MGKSLHKTNSEISKVLLVGLQRPQMSEEEVQASLDELSRLVTTLGYQPVKRTIQKRLSDKSATVLGEGKLAEVAKWTGGAGVVAPGFIKKKSKAALKFKNQTEEDAELDTDIDESIEDESSEESTFEEASFGESLKPAAEEEFVHIDVVIFDTDLSPSQLRNLESAFGCDVLDRTGVIIEIFSRHAKTKAARLQVEIAQLTYQAPRIRETGGSSDRQGGGIGAKGAGETSLELDRRRIRDRIKELKEELASIDQEYETRRARRQQEITVALVGYTNAGKSSLMRAMTGSQVLVADQLFATLDTTVRPLYPETKPKILLSDTVGFIKKLPHDLVASFKSTLDEALYASLLLYVVDSSDVSFRSQLEVTQTVLAEVGAQNTPSRLVLNKIDRLTPEQLANLKTEFPQAIFMSTRDPQDLQKLREILIQEFEQNMIEAEVFVDYRNAKVLGELHSRFRVLSERHIESGSFFKIRGSEVEITKLKEKCKLPPRRL